MPINLKALARAMNDTQKILTPLVTQWLIEHGDDALPPWVVERIADLLLTQPRSRPGTFSASSAGQCPRGQVLAFLGAIQGATDPQLQNIFNDGKWRHLRWQAMLLAMGGLIDIEFGMTWGRMRGVGTMDGLGIVAADHPIDEWRGQEFGFELKGVSTFQFQEFKNGGKPMRKHLQQVHRYFIMSGLKLFVIIYEDKTTQAWEEWVITPDDVMMKEQKEELEWLNRSVDSRSLPNMLPECVAKRGVWRECPFAGEGRTCLAAGKWPGPKTTGFERSKLVKEYQP